MLRDLRLASVATLAAIATAFDLAQYALTRPRRRADPRHMSKPTALEQRRQASMQDLRPGALVAFNALPAKARLVEVIDYLPGRNPDALQGLNVHDGDAAVDLTFGQVLRGYTIIQQAPHIPNVLSDADMDLLRTRVDQRG